VNRRTLLGTVGSSLLVPLAGCSVSLPLSDETRLGWLGLKSYDTEASHDIAVEVRRDETVVHESTHTLERMTERQIPAVVVECTWEYTSAEWTVAAQADDHEWRSWALADRDTDSLDCVGASIEYGGRSWIDEDAPLAFGIRGDCTDRKRFPRGCLSE
jgi:hypothetical protein